MKNGLRTFGACALAGAALLMTIKCSKDKPTTPTQATLTQENAPVAAAAAVNALNPANQGAFPSLPSTKIARTGAASLAHSALNMMVPGMSFDCQPCLAKIGTGSRDTTVTCPGGGTMKVSVSYGGTLEAPSDMKMTSTLTQCVNELGQTMNGSMVVTMVGQLGTSQEMHMSAPNLTYSDAQGNTATMTGYTVKVKGLFGGMTGQGNDTVTIVVSGAVQGTFNGTPVNSQFDNFTIKIITGTSGYTTTISGSTFSACLGGWVTVDGTFAGSGSTVGTGTITVTSGTSVVKMVVAQDGTITVYHNDVLVGNYANQTELSALCK